MCVWSHPSSDEVVDARDTEPHTHGDRVEEEQHEELVVGVAHTIVHPTRNGG